MNEKLTIYLDCDDTILDSSKTVIGILNEKYGTKKTLNDLHDYNYRSIIKDISLREILDIYKSEIFWSRVQMNPTFLDVFNKMKDKFNWIVVSKGEVENIFHKRKYLNKHLTGVLLEGISIFPDGSAEEKSKVNMEGGIQIDDKTDYLLCTNATFKIILKNNKQQYWNRTVPNTDNLYSAMCWKDVEEILEFLSNHPQFSKVDEK